MQVKIKDDGMKTRLDRQGLCGLNEPRTPIVIILGAICPGLPSEVDAIRDLLQTFGLLPHDETTKQRDGKRILAVPVLVDKAHVAEFGEQLIGMTRAERTF